MTKVILGGGLSGLSAAYYLSKVNHQKIVLLEAANRLGGWIKSEINENGVIFEQGPRTIRPSGIHGINTLDLIEELNLSSDIRPILSSNPAAKNRMVYANGELHTLPNSIGSLFKVQKPFSKPLFLWLLGDITAKAKIVNDESIYDFTKRRFGIEIADYLISPLIRGICAGNAKEISVKFLMKNLFEYEQKYGSICKGIFNNIFVKKEPLVRKPLATRAKVECWNVYTFNNGIETLTKALELNIKSNNTDIHKNVFVNKIQFKDNSAVIETSNGNSYCCEHIISSIGAKDLASLLKDEHPELATMLNRIKTVTVGVVNLEFQGNQLGEPGFGFLVPPSETPSILGVIYDSCQHPYDNTVLTVMMGGYWFKELFGDNPSNEFLLNIALKDIQNILKIQTPPLRYKVQILKDCIPQYVVGHESNLSSIDNYIKNNSLPLSLCGSSYHGVGINDVIISAKNAVNNSIY